jgi:DNA-binding response OmpR family regulator
MTDEASSTDPAARVLVIDDEDDVRGMFEIALTKNGFSVEAARSGDEALELVRECPYDVLVVDLGMPGMDGVAFIAEAKRLRAAVGIVVVSGYVNNGDAPALEGMGVTSVLVKPVDLGSLVSSVREQCNR